MYDEAAKQGYATLGAEGQNSARPADIGSIRIQFEEALDAIRSARFRVTQIADTIHGPRPEPVSGTTTKDRPPLSLVEVGLEIGNELRALHNALDRI